MCKRIEERREVTRGTLACRGLWVLAAYGALLVPALVFEKRLGISHETVKALQAIFTLLVSLELMAFGHYFVRRSTT